MQEVIPVDQSPKNKPRSFWFCLGLPLAVGGLSALLTAGSMDLYQRIQRPPLAPPGWVFPLAWTILYLLMGYGSWLCLKAPAAQRRQAWGLYVIQLMLNFLWPLLFFRTQQFYPALLLLLALFLLVLLMAVAFFQAEKRAGLWQLPYVLWLAFALYLNWMIALLN